ncbi:tRNA 5-methoxyuridine(34)/uridine 5-oxyacetic acid(34) synthase CmoB [Oceaniserpentilla sp. 4NH20-0058]|uniref:tRNA 5-methoxyuridine(34)/uridine 5-oxyacetic acid(34) synthase CmoB n=1 Tax=Oceaniserpentilla sp. 4NH20-0058 TaxID=3127660 RepID=UPI0031090E6F
MELTENWFNQYYQDLVAFMQQEKQPFQKWGEVIETQLHDFYIATPHGDMQRWLDAFVKLPKPSNVSCQLNQSAIEFQSNHITPEQNQQVLESLQGLMPWRKGPFQFFDTKVDTEWRSDWKWDRIEPHLSPLHGRTILDVGCGSGYHMWRMLGAGAKRVIGVDPSKLFFWQFEAVKKYVTLANKAAPPVHLLPFKMEDVPMNLRAFDTVFSMGVLYHRRSPLDHLTELQQALRPGGEVVLETLVIEGEEGQVLVPDDRYAMMRNVWFLPSAKTLCQWMRRLGFKNVRIVEQNYTTLDEQHTTDWMTYNSLKDFLDPNDSSKTAEGHPAPLRATIIANV